MLKETTIYDNGDTLGITSEEAPKDRLKETAYINEAEWEVLVMIDREYVQEAILDILEEEIDLKTSPAYLEYKENLKQVLAPELNKHGAEMIKTTYLDSKSITLRTRCILEILDEIIYNKQD